MARRSRVLLLALAAALVGSVAAAGRTLQQADTSDPAVGNVPTRSGLELVQSSAGSGSFLGRTLNDLTGTGTTSLFLATNGSGTATDGTYGFADTIKTVNMTIGNGTAPFAALGVGLNSEPTDAISKPFLWLMDTQGSTVYKVDTVLNTVAGAFHSQPTNALAGNPALIGVDSFGDAWVGNAYTFANSAVGSLAKIGSDPAGCGASNTFSTDSTALAFTTSKTIGDIYSGVSAGFQTLLDSLKGAGGDATTLATLTGATADSCIKRFESLAVKDSTANQVAISAVAVDGADNVYAVAVNEATRFAGFVRVYQLPKGQDNQPTIIGSTTNIGNAATDIGLPDAGNGGFAMPASGQLDGPGAPGGYDAVVDKYGYLWTGAGDYQYSAHTANGGQANSTSVTGGYYGVLRIPVGTVAGSDNIQGGVPTFFPVGHETNALALSPDGNLWVAGAASASIFPTDPLQLGAGLVNDHWGAWTPFKTVALPAVTTDCGSSSGLGDDAVDPCCVSGSFNGGIAVDKFTGDVYVSNECQNGKVARLRRSDAADDSTYTLDQIITASGSLTYPSSINADYAGNVWITSNNVTQNDNSGTTAVFQIATGAAAGAAAALPVSGLTFPNYIGGGGDAIGANTVQPPATGSWSWIHDTGISGYNKWGTGQPAAKVAFSLLNSTLGTLTIDVYTSDNCANPAATGDHAGPFTASSSSLSTQHPTLAAGQCIQIKATLTRGAKVAPEIGPQAFGVSPALASINIVPANQPPTATCQNLTGVPADDDVAQPLNRVCGVANDPGGAIDVNNGSLEPDTAEFDTLVPITAASYSTNYFTWSDASVAAAVTQPVGSWSAGDAAAYPWLDNYPGLPTYGDAQPSYTQNTSTPVTLSLADAHGGTASCSATVQLQDTTKPVWLTTETAKQVANGVTISPTKNAANDVPTLCAWPPSYKYYCWLDVTNNIETEVLPLYDNCAGSFPLVKQGPETFTCTDTDPRTQDGDCVLQFDNLATTANGGRPVYNLCVKAQLRTTYTGLARIYYATFNVLDGGTFQGLNGGTSFTRAIKIPPLWSFNTKSVCPRAQYDYSASSVGATDTSQSVDSPPAAGR